jgi:hypothetical protein
MLSGSGCRKLFMGSRGAGSNGQIYMGKYAFSPCESSEGEWRNRERVPTEVHFRRKT